MSANIAEIKALFPEQKIATVTSSQEFGGTIRGPYPYVALKKYFPDTFISTFSRVLDAILDDERWGPVFNGDLSRYDDDHSTADFAMCGELARRGLDASDIDTAMRASGLYREKWERDDYRQGTITKVFPPEIALVGAPAPNSFDQATIAMALPLEKEPDNKLELDHLDPDYLAKAFGGDEAPAANRALGPLDLANGKIRISTDEPPPRDWVVDGLLLAGKSAVLAGFGGVSKTQLAIQLAIAITLGKSFADKQVKQGGVMLLLGEEDQGEISRRVSAVVRYKKYDQSQITQIENDMCAFPFVGQDMRLTVKPKEGLKESSLVQKIIDTAVQVGDIKLIVLDHVALVHGGDFNTREDAALTMQVINHIGQETGAAVLLLAHSPKSAAGQEKSDATMVAGSTAFVDQARGAWILTTMRDTEARTFGIDDHNRKQHVSLDVVKNNYASTGEVSWFRRISFDKIGLLEHVPLIPQAIGGKATQQLEERIVSKVKATPGCYSKTKFRNSQSGKKGPLKASKADVERAIDDLLADGRLVNREPTPEQRKQYDHNSRVKHVLDVGI